MKIRVFLSNSSPADEMHALFSPSFARAAAEAQLPGWTPRFFQSFVVDGLQPGVPVGTVFRSTFLAQDRSALLLAPTRVLCVQRSQQVNAAGGT